MLRRFSEVEKTEVWDRLESGEAIRSIARQLGQVQLLAVSEKPGSFRPGCPSTGRRRHSRPAARVR